MAVRGRRPLDADLPLNGSGPFYHEHFWFTPGFTDEFGRDNLGYFDDSTVRDDQSRIGQRGDYNFDHDPFNYDDNLLLDAIRNISMGQYLLFFNDCQDFVWLVLEEYDRLAVERGRPELRNPDYQQSACECDDEIYSYNGGE